MSPSNNQHCVHLIGHAHKYRLLKEHNCFDLDRSLDTVSVWTHISIYRFFQIRLPVNKTIIYSCRKRNPLGIRNRNRNRASPSSHSSPCRTRLVTTATPTALPTPSPRCLKNPFEQGGVYMSPGAIGCPSGVNTPSSVASEG